MSTVDTKFLAEHDVEAMFEGIKAIPCRMRTALCPDKCGHASEAAVFEVLRYNKLTQGEGDKKEEEKTFHADLKKESPEIVATIQALKKDQKVNLVWVHNYVTTHEEGGTSASRPERPVKKLTPVSTVVSVETKLLAEHDVAATFDGIQQLPCHFRTALCPDRCGHATEAGVFKIVSYNKLVQGDGDKKAEEKLFHADLKKESPEVVATVRGLAKDQKVNLVWQHNYVTTHFEGGTSSSGPERPVKKLTPV